MMRILELEDSKCKKLWCDTKRDWRRVYRNLYIALCYAEEYKTHYHVLEKQERIQFINKYYPDALNVSITHRAVKI